MAMTLLELRNYVRTQTQTTQSELPDSTLNAYLQEAFTRTVSFENQWPWFEKTWNLMQSKGGFVIPIPADCNTAAITGLTSDDQRWRLQLTPHVTAQDTWGNAPTTGGYAAFSVWAGQFVLWPNTVAEEDAGYKMTGFRFPIDWISQGPSALPDIDPRLHQALAHYAIALAYAQQEDETLESTYMQRWQTDAMTIRGAVMEPTQATPMIFGPQSFTAIGNQRRRGPTLVINTPQSSELVEEVRALRARVEQLEA
jgi:hypothetical protein